MLKCVIDCETENRDNIIAWLEQNVGVITNNTKINGYHVVADSDKWNMDFVCVFKGDDAVVVEYKFMFTINFKSDDIKILFLLTFDVEITENSDNRFVTIDRK